MITEQEERVLILIKNTINYAIKYYNSIPFYPEEEVIEGILIDSEVALHPEAIDELVEWLKQSKL